MGLDSAILNLTISLYNDGLFSGMKSVMEIGSQDIHADVQELNTVLSATLKKKTNVKCPKDIYALLGLESYQCIDADGRHGAYVFDLNEDIRATGFNNQYDLITNYGTTEHCINQYNAFKNIHDLCGDGGIMIHYVPFQGYVNHGYFNYQPSFFYDMVRANDYSIIGEYLTIGNNNLIVNYSEELWNSLIVTNQSSFEYSIVLKKNSGEDFQNQFHAKFFERSLIKNKYGMQKAPKLLLPFDIKNISTKDLVNIVLKRIKSKITNSFTKD